MRHPDSRPEDVSDPRLAPVDPPAPMVITVSAAGVVEMVDVPEIVEPVREAEEPETKTSPAPPPPPSVPKPPPPPPPITATSIAEIPVGVLLTQLS